MQHKMPEDKKRIRRLFMIDPETDRRLNELGHRIGGKDMPRSRVLDDAVLFFASHQPSREELDSLRKV